MLLNLLDSNHMGFWLILIEELPGNKHDICLWNLMCSLGSKTEMSLPPCVSQFNLKTMDLQGKRYKCLWDGCSSVGFLQKWDRDILWTWNGPNKSLCVSCAPSRKGSWHYKERIHGGACADKFDGCLVRGEISICLPQSPSPPQWLCSTDVL